jgi:2-methylaconitate cis-trans-isomerase PrpF
MQERWRAVFVRGGTSRALVFRGEELPADPARRDQIFCAALGSPDPYGRQLDGLGGGVSSLSKVAVVSSPGAPDRDVDYTFGQVDVRRAFVDYRGNCGNISSAIGPYAVDERLVAAAGPAAVVRIFNTNTRKLIVARFPVHDGEAAVDGDFAIPGVPGTGARIALDFRDPGGAVTGRLLPTGRARDELAVAGLPGVGALEASIVDATNPVVFVRAADLGLTGTEPPGAVDADPELGRRLEAIRAAAAIRIGLASNAADAAARSPAVPKIAAVAPARAFTTLSGEAVPEGDVDLVGFVISMGRAHRAFALTAAMCLAVAAQIPGTVVAEAAGSPARAAGRDLRLGTPSGVLPVGAAVEPDGAGYRARSVRVYRTARRLMEGWVRVPPPAPAARPAAVS